MTTRQRQATGGATAILAHSNGVGSSHDRAAPMTWEEWFRHASVQQRSTALGLALQQGLLYPHQLPPISNGVKSVPVSEKDRDTEVSVCLAALLKEKCDSLPTPQLEAISFHDGELDALQQQAVIRALATPDVFLLNGLPGVGKSRVLAEILLQAAARGQRALLLGAGPASIDVVLERLAGRTDVLPLRYLDVTEKLDSLPGWLTGMTPENQQRAFHERVTSAAQHRRAESESACRTRRALEPAWQALHTCLERTVDLTTQLLRIDNDAAQLAQAIEREADAPGANPFSLKIAEWRRQCEAATTKFDTRRQALLETQTHCDTQIADMAAQISALEPRYRARRDARIWSLAYWTVSASVLEEMETLKRQEAEIAGRRAANDQEIAQLDHEREATLARFAAERAAFIAAEFDAKRQHLERERVPLLESARTLDEEWRSLGTQLGLTDVEKSAVAVKSAQQAWLSQKQRDEEQCQFAQQWSEFVDSTVVDYSNRLPDFANVIAMTMQRWLSDAKLRDSLSAPFDFVVIEDADTLADADLVRLAREGHRCILSAAGPCERLGSAYQRVWQTLGGDDGLSQCFWRRDDGRLVCRLTAFVQDEQHFLEIESLADAPDIELGILQRPSAAPNLAQVVFGPTRSFGDAFQFMRREVQEFPLAPLGQTTWWCDDPEQVRCNFGMGASQSVEWAEIEPGLRLGTITDGAAITVACILFSKSAGWSRENARAWLERNRPGNNRERTAFLETPHRFRPALARILSQLSCAKSCGLPGIEEGARPLEFIAVPTLPKKDWPTAGAGLELDLSVARMADRLPVGLRQGLPPRGFVNYVEAQALVRRLETYCQKDMNGQAARVVATALYESQVELIRRLVAQSETLRNSRVPIDITLPDRLRQRECDVLFLSLTRSHDGVCDFSHLENDLILALTRARNRLFVFGDAGTLNAVTAPTPIAQLIAWVRDTHHVPTRPAAVAV